MNAAIRATLRQYWVPQDDEVVAQFEMDDWTEALVDWPVPDVRDALRRWVIDNPRRRPNYGDILGILRADRGREAARRMEAIVNLSKLEPPVVERITGTRAEELMREVGIPVKRFGS